MRSRQAQDIEWSLVKKSLQNTLTPEEREQVDIWLSVSEAHRFFYQKQIASRKKESFEEMSAVDYERDLENYVKNIHCFKGLSGRNRSIRIFRHVAIWLLPLFFPVLYFWYFSGTEEYSGQFAQICESSVPEVILITGNGTQIKLYNDSVRGSQMIGENISYQNRNIIYNVMTNDSTPELRPETHKLIVPWGGEYQATLADGSKVWLNSQTELSYPEYFTGKQREVFLDGEAYFNVAKSVQPFLVHVGDITIKVYGTQFNISNYNKTAVRAVLVSGKIGITLNDQSAREYLLSPDQMAEINTTTGHCTIKIVDTEIYTAWKDGYFSFECETIEDIMKQLSQWYDIEVVFENELMRTLPFSGRIERSKDIREVLSLIERTLLIRFRIQDRQIIIQ